MPPLPEIIIKTLDTKLNVIEPGISCPGYGSVIYHVAYVDYSAVACTGKSVKAPGKDVRNTNQTDNKQELIKRNSSGRQCVVSVSQREIDDNQHEDAQQICLYIVCIHTLNYLA